MNNYTRLLQHLKKLKYKINESNKKFIKRNFYFNNNIDIKNILIQTSIVDCECKKKIEQWKFIEKNYRLLKVSFVINSIIGTSIKNTLKSSDDTGLRICYLYNNTIKQIPIFFGINKSIKKCKSKKNKGCFYLNINNNQDNNYITTRLSNIIKNLKLHEIITNNMRLKLNNYVKPTLEYYKCFNLSEKKCNKKRTCNWTKKMYGLREGYCSSSGENIIQNINTRYIHPSQPLRRTPVRRRRSHHTPEQPNQPSQPLRLTQRRHTLDQPSQPAQPLRRSHVRPTQRRHTLDQPSQPAQPLRRRHTHHTLDQPNQHSQPAQPLRRRHTHHTPEQPNQPSQPVQPLRRRRSHHTPEQPGLLRPASHESLESSTLNNLNFFNTKNPHEYEHKDDKELQHLFEHAKIRNNSHNIEGNNHKPISNKNKNKNKNLKKNTNSRNLKSTRSRFREKVRHSKQPTEKEDYNPIINTSGNTYLPVQSNNDTSNNV